MKLFEFCHVGINPHSGKRFQALEEIETGEWQYEPLRPALVAKDFTLLKRLNRGAIILFVLLGYLLAFYLGSMQHAPAGLETAFLDGALVGARLIQCARDEHLMIPPWTKEIRQRLFARRDEMAKDISCTRFLQIMQGMEDTSQ